MASALGPASAHKTLFGSSVHLELNQINLDLGSTFQPGEEVDA